MKTGDRVRLKFSIEKEFEGEEFEELKPIIPKLGECYTIQEVDFGGEEIYGLISLKELLSDNGNYFTWRSDWFEPCFKKDFKEFHKKFTND